MGILVRGWEVLNEHLAGRGTNSKQTGRLHIGCTCVLKLQQSYMLLTGLSLYLVIVL